MYVKNKSIDEYLLMKNIEKV